MRDRELIQNGKYPLSVATISKNTLKLEYNNNTFRNYSVYNHICSCPQKPSLLWIHTEAVLEFFYLDPQIQLDPTSENI
jgi:hypothetical protein